MQVSTDDTEKVGVEKRAWYTLFAHVLNLFWHFMTLAELTGTEEY